MCSFATACARLWCVLIAWHCLTVPCFGFVGRASAAAADTCRKFDHDAFGVQHFPILGTTTFGDNQFHGIVHIWLKVRVSTSRDAELRGIVWFENTATGQSNWNNQGEGFDQWKPVITLHGNHDGRRVCHHNASVAFQLVQYSSHVVPVPMMWRVSNILLTLSRPCMHYILHVDDWSRKADVLLPTFASPVAKALEATSQRIQRPLFVLGLQPFVTRTIAFVHELVVWYTNIHYHFKVGFDAAVIYTSPHGMRVLEDSPLRSNLGHYWQRVFLVQWDRDQGMDPVLSILEDTNSKNLAQNHMLLGLWGTNSWVYLNDVDEFLFFRTPMSVQHAFQEGCMQELVATRSMCEAAFRELHVYCKNFTQETGEPEYALWQHAPWREVVQCSRQYSLLAPVDQGSGGKCIAHADHVFNYYLHAGMPIPSSNCTLQGVSKQCAMFAHFPNLFKVRVPAVNLTGDPPASVFEPFALSVDVPQYDEQLGNSHRCHDALEL